MRIERWDPNKFDQAFENIAIERLVEAAEVVASAARRKCKVGTISRPMYKTGDYPGVPWTARKPGQLKKSIRVVRKKTKSGRAFSKKRNVRVYAGNFLAYYADIVEFHDPFMRPALSATLGKVKAIIGAK